MSNIAKDRPRRIEIKDDVLLIDEDFHRDVLADASRKTGKRLEAQGLPYVMVAGRKYRPLKAGQAWLANRIKSNQPRKMIRRHPR